MSLRRLTLMLSMAALMAFGVAACAGGDTETVTETVPAAGANYHCSIHPGMVGAINGSSGTAPPCSGIYCAD